MINSINYLINYGRPCYFVSPLSSTCCQQEYTNYNQKHCSKKVPWSDKFEFVNGWYLLIIVSDFLCVVGSILKIEIQTKVTGGRISNEISARLTLMQHSFLFFFFFFFYVSKALTSYDVCSIFLGTGTMLVWIGVIRYMGYFRKYNVRSALRAAPRLLSLLCIGVGLVIQSSIQFNQFV